MEHADAGAAADASPPWLEQRTSGHGVAYEKYVPLPAMAEWECAEEDRLLQITWNGRADEDEDES